MSSRQQPHPGAGAPLRKRFYKAVRSEERTTKWAVLLDGRTLRTPGRLELLLPCRGLAKVIADEWDAQTSQIDPVTMPMTRLCNSAVDGVAVHLQEVQAELVRYAGNDLICYRADHPEALRDRQVEVWDPILRWAAEAHDIKLRVTAGVMPISQLDQSLTAFGKAIEAISGNAFALAAFHTITTLTGSATLALSHLHGRCTAQEIWQAAHLDEDWQAEQWGRDEEARLRQAARHTELMTASQLLQLVSQKPHGLCD